jgi:hypothetical protein
VADAGTPPPVQSPIEKTERRRLSVNYSVARSSPHCPTARPAMRDDAVMAVVVRALRCPPKSLRPTVASCTREERHT